jgi:hypothetical protein
VCSSDLFAHTYHSRRGRERRQHTMAGIACPIDSIANPWNRKGPALLGLRRRCHELSVYT